MTYFVIYQSEDDLTIEEMDANELLKRLGGKDYCSRGRKPLFNTKIPSTDMYEWSVGDIFIIKGEAVEPKPVQVVEKWEL